MAHAQQDIVCRDNIGKGVGMRLNNANIVLALALTAMAGCSGINSQSADAPLPSDAAASVAPAAPKVGAPTADAAVRKTPVVPGRRARVFIFTATGDDCEPLPAPELTITAPPSKGDLSFEPGQETTVATSGKGTCTGKPATGTGVYYTARAGQTGADRFAVTARLKTGETATRNFEVHIAP